jgi:hypothetical protein
MLTEQQLEPWNLVAPEDVTAREGQSLLHRLRLRRFAADPDPAGPYITTTTGGSR